MKKVLWILFLIVILVAGFGAWCAYGSATKFPENNKYIYVYNSQTAKQEVETQLSGSNGITGFGIFHLLGDNLHIWEKVKEGRFELKKGESLLQILRTFRNNKQADAKLVINKIRTKSDLAALIGKQFKIDSTNAMIYLTSNDSLIQVGADTNTVFSLIIPDTYLFKWNSSMTKILSRLKDYEETFWSKKERKDKASKLQLTPLQVYILASIVEEETNDNSEKGLIASVYYNRYKQNMRLGADPTVKFALGDFTIKRILSGHLQVQSPYNTYRNNGLPPGPICTPSTQTIDAVLDMPTTDYLFFVADKALNGKHHFSKTFEEHVQFANDYRQKLDSIQIK